MEVCILLLELEGSVLERSSASSHLFMKVSKHGGLLMGSLIGQPEARQSALHAIS